MRRTVAAGIALIGSSLLLSCSPPTSPLEVAGIYSLRTVNGLALPYVFPQVGPTRVEALDDTFTLNPAGTYAEAGHKMFTTGAAVTVTYPVDAGNFTRRGESVLLESLIYGSSTGTIKDGTFTLVQSGLTLVYQK